MPNNFWLELRVTGNIECGQERIGKMLRSAGKNAQNPNFRGGAMKAAQHLPVTGPTTKETFRRGMAQLAVALLLVAMPLRPMAEVRIFQSEIQPFRAITFTEGLENPWGLAFLPDGRKLVTERPGRLRLVGAGGLLDVALHPDFARNGWVYLSYAGTDANGYGTEVLRGRLDGHALRDVAVIFRLQPKSATGHHFGSRLVFDRQDFIYITLGERGDKERAQRLDDHAGSVIRLHDDGRVPADNPFVGKAGARPEKFTLGHRNIQGAALHPQTGELWAHEHGPQGGDEINIVRAGQNYGWPVITYGRNYITGTSIGEGTAKAGMVQPLWQWTPSIAPALTVSSIY